MAVLLNGRGGLRWKFGTQEVIIVSDLFDLAGKVAVVTASTKGMGLAIARALDAAGARLVISGRSHESAEATAVRLRQEDAFEVTALACDITDAESVQRFAADAHAAFGRVDALVPNAAGKPPVGSLLNQTVDHFDEIMANWVRGSLALVLALAPNADPLAEWIASLEALGMRIPDDVLVLPAHNQPFTDLHARLARRAANQQHALERLHAALREPRRAVDTFGALFVRAISPEDASTYGLATGEVRAHLNS